jgi:hypothetical protein
VVKFFSFKDCHNKKRTMNHINAKEVFGMTQDYMAMLLQVSRSQWSIYVLGKRDLLHDLKKEALIGLNQVNNQTGLPVRAIEKD